MSLKISNRMEAIPFSPIRKVFAEANKMEAEGIKVTHMEIGRPDFDTPELIKEAAIKSLEAGNVHYSPNRGTLALRQAISEKLKRDNHLSIDPEQGIVVTAGCKEAILDTILAFIDPGDEVIIPDPAWLEYRQIVTLAGGMPVTVPLKAEEGFLLDPDDVRKCITNKTKMILINSPSNPTGSVLSEKSLETLAHLAIQHDLLVLSDEIYEKLTYDAVHHISIASFPGMFERTIVINGFSKAYAMDGWRLGYAAGAAELINGVLKVHQYNTSSVTSFVQDGGEWAYRENQKSVNWMVSEFDRRRKMVVGCLRQIPGVECVIPKGAFYVFPSFRSFGYTSTQLAKLFLEQVQIACVPGCAFGANGEGYIRMSYSTGYEQLEGAMDRLSFFLTHLRKK